MVLEGDYRPDCPGCVCGRDGRDQFHGRDQWHHGRVFAGGAGAAAAGE